MFLNVILFRTYDESTKFTRCFFTLPSLTSFQLWENTLINIAFRHRHVIENMATLDVLRKQ